MVNKSTYISGSLIDHVDIKKTMMTEFSINATLENIYFSDYDAMKIAIEQNNNHFHTVS